MVLKAQTTTSLEKILMTEKELIGLRMVNEARARLHYAVSYLLTVTSNQQTDRITDRIHVHPHYIAECQRAFDKARDLADNGLDLIRQDGTDIGTPQCF